MRLLWPALAALLGPAMRQFDPVKRPFAAVGEDIECAVGITTYDGKCRERDYISRSRK